MTRSRTSTRLVAFWLVVLPLVAAPIVATSPGGAPDAGRQTVLVILLVAWAVVFLGIVAGWRRSGDRRSTAVVPPSPSPGGRTTAATSRWAAWASRGAPTGDATEPEPYPWRRAFGIAFTAFLIGLALQVALDLVLPLAAVHLPALVQAVLAQGVALLIVGRGSGLRSLGDWARATALVVGLYLGLGFLIIVLTAT